MITCKNYQATFTFFWQLLQKVCKWVKILLEPSLHDKNDFKTKITSFPLPFDTFGGFDQVWPIQDLPGLWVINLHKSLTIWHGMFGNGPYDLIQHKKNKNILTMALLYQFTQNTTMAHDK